MEVRAHCFFYGIVTPLRLWTGTYWKWKRECEPVRWSDSDVRIAEVSGCDDHMIGGGWRSRE